MSHCLIRAQMLDSGRAAHSDPFTAAYQGVVGGVVGAYQGAVNMMSGASSSASVPGPDVSCVLFHASFHKPRQQSHPWSVDVLFHKGPILSEVCVRPGCGQPTWNGQPGEYCTKLCLAHSFLRDAESRDHKEPKARCLLSHGDLSGRLRVPAPFGRASSAPNPPATLLRAPSTVPGS